MRFFKDEINYVTKSIQDIFYVKKRESDIICSIVAYPF